MLLVFCMPEMVFELFFVRSRGRLDRICPFLICFHFHLRKECFIFSYNFALLHFVMLPSFFLKHRHSISSPDSIGLEIEKKCQAVFPLQNVFIRKVKMLKKPKFDLLKLMEQHGDSAEDTGAALDKAAAANTVKALKGAGGRL